MRGNRSSTSRLFRLHPRLIVLAGLLAAPGWLSAATQTTTFTVTLTLQNNCLISANPLNFGTQGVLSANVDQTTSLSVTCSTAAPYNVGLDAGTTTGSTVAARLLAGSGGATVGFQLYSDSAHTQVWGNTIGTNTVASSGTGLTQNFTAYGRIPAQTQPPSGQYIDTIIVTVSY